MNIAELFTARVAMTPIAPAIIDGHRGRTRVFSYADLDEAVARAAARLRGAGLEPGDTVLVFHAMSLELYILLEAILRAGLVAMFIDPSMGRSGIERCLRKHPPAGFAGSPKAHVLRVLCRGVRQIAHKFCTRGIVPGGIDLAAATTTGFKRVEPRSGGDAALLTFTSGTTGPPKAVVRSHELLLRQHAVLAKSFPSRAGDIELTALPMFVLANLANGVVSLLPDANVRHPGSIDPLPVLGQLAAQRPTRIVASPAFLERLTEACSADDPQLSSLDRIYTGGGPVFPRLVEHLGRVAPQATVQIVYGSTEAEPIATVSHQGVCVSNTAATRRGAGLLVGHPVDGIEVRIHRDCWGTPLGPYDEQGFAARCRGINEPGEIVVSGPHVLSGYLDGEGDAETKFDVENVAWHRTGDAGYLDESGRLWLLGRCSARIEDARGILYPFAVECIAQGFPEVKRAALVGWRGMRVLAVEPRKGSRQISSSVLRKRARALGVDAIEFYHKIPVDNRHNSKVNYAALTALIEKRKLTSVQRVRAAVQEEWSRACLDEVRAQGLPGGPPK